MSVDECFGHLTLISWFVDLICGSADSGAGACYAFRDGNCTRGSSCRFSHDSGSSRGGGGGRGDDRRDDRRDRGGYDREDRGRSSYDRDDRR